MRIEVCADERGSCGKRGRGRGRGGGIDTRRVPDGSPDGALPMVLSLCLQFIWIRIMRDLKAARGAGNLGGLGG